MGTAPGDLAYYGIEAGASIQANGTVNHQRDVAFAAPAASVYAGTLSRELPGGAAGNPALLLATITGLVSGQVGIANTSNLIKSVSTFTGAGAAGDRPFDFIAMRLLGT